MLEHCLNPRVEQTVIGSLDVNELRRLATSDARRRSRHPEPCDSWFEVDVFVRIPPFYRLTNNSLWETFAMSRPVSFAAAFL